jgi:hypothetical protein
MNVFAGTITSSSGFNFIADNIACNAAVPEFKATAYLVPIKPLNSRSNLSTKIPDVSHPDRSTEAISDKISDISSSEKYGRPTLIILILESGPSIFKNMSEVELTKHWYKHLNFFRDDEDNIVEE